MERISIHQLFTLTVLYQLGTTIITGFATSAGRDGWISIIISTAIGILIILGYLLLMRMNPGLTLVEWYQVQFGRWIGTLVAWQYPLLFIYYIGRIVTDIKLLIGPTILSNVPPLVIIVPFLIIIAYAVDAGIETIGRLGEIMLPIILLTFFVEIVLILGSDIIRIKNIQPIMGEGWGRIWETIYPSGITQTFGQTIEFSFLWVLTKQPERIVKTTVFATFVSGMIITVFDFLAIAVLGGKIFEAKIYPLYVLIQQISIGNFLENVDALGILYIVVTVFFKTSIHLFTLTKMIQQLTYTRSNRVFILPVLIIGLMVGLNMADNASEHIYVAFKIFPKYLWIHTLFIYPGILLVVTLIRKKWFTNNKLSSN